MFFFSPFSCLEMGIEFQYFCFYLLLSHSKTRFVYIYFFYILFCFLFPFLSFPLIIIFFLLIFKQSPTHVKVVWESLFWINLSSHHDERKIKMRKIQEVLKGGATSVKTKDRMSFHETNKTKAVFHNGTSNSSKSKQKQSKTKQKKEEEKSRRVEMKSQWLSENGIGISAEVGSWITKLFKKISNNRKKYKIRGDVANEIRLKSEVEAKRGREREKKI